MKKYTSNWFIKLWVSILIILLIYAIHKNLQIGSIYNNIGFWVGLWDGFIFPLKWIQSVFGGNIDYYIHPNPTFENMYLLGFMFGIGGFGIFKIINIVINLIFKLKNNYDFKRT